MIRVLDRHGDDVVDLENAEIEFYLKDEQTDDDESALLEKSSENGDEEVEILTPASDGEAVIKIETGDTDGFLDADGEDDVDRLEDEVFFWAVRISRDGHRITSLTGDLEVTAS